LAAALILNFFFGAAGAETLTAGEPSSWFNSFSRA
jgi:hypothetical protein